MWNSVHKLHLTILEAVKAQIWPILRECVQDKEFLVSNTDYCGLLEHIISLVSKNSESTRTFDICLDSIIC